MERFLRPVGPGTHDVYVGGYVVGSVVTLGADRIATVLDAYGEAVDLGAFRSLTEAARAVADARAEIERDMEAQILAERRAEFAMSYVCGGGHPDDVGAAWLSFGHLV